MYDGSMEYVLAAVAIIGVYVSLMIVFRDLLHMHLGILGFGPKKAKFCLHDWQNYSDNNLWYTHRSCSKCGRLQKCRRYDLCGKYLWEDMDPPELPQARLEKDGNEREEVLRR